MYDFRNKNLRVAPLVFSQIPLLCPQLRLSPAEVLTGALARSWELLQALVKISNNSVSNKRSADMKPANTWFSFWSMAWSFACVNFFINFVVLSLDVNVRACGFDYEEENWVLKCLGKFLSWRIAGGCTYSSPIPQMSLNLVCDDRNKNLRVPPLVFFTNCRPQFCRPVPY